MTEQERKKIRRRLPLGLCLNLGLTVVLFGAASLLVNQVKIQVQEQALTEAEAKAELILDRNLATHSYFSHVLKPRVFQLTEPVRGKDFFDPSWMSSTYAVREIDKNFKTMADEDYYYKECAINARSPENEADAFEKSFIEELNKNPELQYRSLIRNIGNTYYYVTLRRGEVMEESCLRCHSVPDRAPKGLVDVYGPERSFNRRAKEVVSAISIRVPLSTAYQRAEQFSKHLSTVLVIVLAIVFAFQFFIHRFLIINPLTRLKNKAFSISENEDLLGEEIELPVTREFGELTAAFNTMSKKLRHQIDHLEVKVNERTAELQNSNSKLQKALDEIKTLRGILPVCSFCKSVRNDQGYWSRLEAYLSEHSEVEISHGICPSCMKKNYPEEFAALQQKGELPE